MTGPPAAIWRRKIGTTEPEDPSTLPKRTLAKRVSGKRASAASTAHSASALEAPMTVAGSTALSVETRTKVRTPESPGDARHHARGERVVAHRLDRVALHQPDVLVGGGVEDDGGAVLGEDLAHPLLPLAVRQHRDGVQRVAVLDQLALDLEQVVLGVVEQDQAARPDARDLAAELRADRAAGAGDEHARAR